MFLGNYKCRSNRTLNKPNLLGGGNVLPNYSSNLRKINTIKHIKGGRTRFGNLDYPILLNSYSSAEGSPGGYGFSPKNRF